MKLFPTNGDKSAWRAWAKARRQEIDVAAVSAQVRSRLVSLPEWEAARHILLYLALPTEVRVEELLGQEDSGKRFYAPRCAENRQLAIHPFSAGTPIRRESFGLREPDPDRVPTVEPTVIDLAIVPALLLSEEFTRLGYGGGYYDRFLPRLRPDTRLVGVVPDALLVPSLPVEPHDVRLHRIVTEQRSLRRADMPAPIRLPDSD